MMQRSQKFMLYAAALVFIGQFFDFGTNSFYYTTTGGGFTLLNESKATMNGWSYHSPYFLVPVLAIITWVFYTRSPKYGWYWAAAIFLFICSIGSGLGAVLALIGAGCGFYAVYLKNKERKRSVGSTRSETIN